jgi:hypothetical protein
MRGIEADFLVKLKELEKTISYKFLTPKNIRAQDSRFIAVRTIASIELAISHPNPARTSIVPSLRRCERSVAGWALMKTEQLTGKDIDIDWAVDFLGKVLSGNTTKADLELFENAPPAPGQL